MPSIKLQVAVLCLMTSLMAAVWSGAQDAKTDSLVQSAITNPNSLFNSKVDQSIDSLPKKSNTKNPGPTKQQKLTAAQIKLKKDIDQYTGNAKVVSQQQRGSFGFGEFDTPVELFDPSEILAAKPGVVQCIAKGFFNNDKLGGIVVNYHFSSGLALSRTIWLKDEVIVFVYEIEIMLPNSFQSFAYFSEGKIFDIEKVGQKRFTADKDMTQVEAEIKKDVEMLSKLLIVEKSKG